MKFITSYKKSTDSRGTFVGIMNTGTWEEINIIETEAENTRGGHYHRDTLELFYILEGEIEIKISKMGSAESKTYSICQGHIILIEPCEIHTFRCLTRCKWINLLSKKIDESDPDFHQ